MRILVNALLGAVFASSIAAADPSTFKMYPSKNFDFIDDSCDVFTELQLEMNEDGTGLAILTDQIGPKSICTIFIPENKREYKVETYLDDCGSKVLYGKMNSIVNLLLVDHRTRRCADEIPSLVIVQEFDLKGGFTQLFSKDR